MCLRATKSFSEIEALLELFSKFDEFASLVPTSSTFTHQMSKLTRFFHVLIVSYDNLSEDG